MRLREGTREDAAPSRVLQRTLRWVGLLWFFSGLPAIAFAEPSAFFGLGTLQGVGAGAGASALGVSADGAVVVGSSTSDLGLVLDRSAFSCLPDCLAGRT